MLLTMRYLTTERIEVLFEGKYVKEKSSSKSSKENKNKKIIPNVICKFNEERKRFVWLRTLDMEPISRRTNLFAAILARIDELCGRKHNGYKPPVSASLDNTDPYEKVLQNLTGTT